LLGWQCIKFPRSALDPSGHYRACAWKVRSKQGLPEHFQNIPLRAFTFMDVWLTRMFS